MKNRSFYGLFIVCALAALPGESLADTGSTNAALKASEGSLYNYSGDTPYRTISNTNTLVTTKSSYQPIATSSVGNNAQNLGSRKSASPYNYRQGYRKNCPARMANKNRPILPGHAAKASVPELDASESYGVIALLLGSALVLQSRRRRRSTL
ncbi:MAG: hypothetical protein JXA30_19245 [Deltaproteobacteria bacterium]|nr:hypothetical protein [Deltaproteobacteria bacterium]